MRRVALLMAMVTALVGSQAAAQTTQTYVYDVHGRLTGATAVTGTSTASVAGYNYDDADNRTVRRNDGFNQPVHAYELASGEQFVLQQELRSPNNNVRLYFAMDGNLILACGSTLLWATWTYGGQAALLQMQTGGDLAMFSGGGNLIWNTGTGVYAGSRLLVQNDGNLVIYDSGGTPRWSTGTGGSC